MRGYTLVELLCVVLLSGVCAASLAPAARRQRDRAMVVSAREAVVALVAEARLAGMEWGSASVRVTTAPAQAEARSAAGTLRIARLQEEFDVSIALSGGTTEVELAYDALGLGRMASQTITFRRGSATAGLIVSSYGRARRL
jgi:prepilin-type N-terminal cleavage/methylation domain-containing protein